MVNLARHKARVMISLEHLAHQAEDDHQPERAARLWQERETVQDERSALLRMIWLRRGESS